MKNKNLQNLSLRKRKGFTLIELIVVIAILAILAAIAIPTFVGQLNKAKVNTHNANVMSLSSAAAVALAENGNPTASATFPGWGSGTGALVPDGDVGDGIWDPDKYIDTWPTNPFGAGTTQTYQVGISTDGIITVTPDKVAATATDATRA